MASFIFPSVLITGANRGLGLNILKHILKSPTVPQHIVATCRSLKAENAKQLQILAEKNSNLHVLEFDMADVFQEPRLLKLVKQISDIVQGSGLSLLVNNAGILVRESFDEMRADSLRSQLDVNAVAPSMLIKAFRPLLKRAVDVKKTGEQPQAAVVNISSILGSIDLMNDGNKLGYKVSKAALNMVTKAVSGEFTGDGIAVVSVHPGWVQTDMGGQSAPVTIEMSVSSIMKIISSLKKSQTGMFLNYDGTTLPW